MSASPLYKIEEHMGDAAYWPSWMRELALKNHYKYHDRFTFMLHFLGNVVPPYIVVEHMLSRLRDVSAVDHVNNLLMHFYTGLAMGRGQLTNGYKYWDVELSMNLPIACERHCTQSPDNSHPTVNER